MRARGSRWRSSTPRACGPSRPDAGWRVAGGLLAGSADLLEQPIAFRAPPRAYAAVLTGIWRRRIAVPSPFAPASRDRPRHGDTEARLVEASDLLTAAPARHVPEVAAALRAMILYTSGTTTRPKRVVTTHANIKAQVDSLLAAWEWRANDRILLTLPLHHVHGIINGLAAALAAGATCEMLPAFDADLVWDRLASGGITVFTAVPTIYHRLIAAWDQAPADVRRSRAAAAAQLRLMMSGWRRSAADDGRWQEMTGRCSNATA